MVVPLALALAGASRADVVVGHSPDNTAGHLIGGSVSLLLGGFAFGGPAGAIGAGVLGAWLGGEIQQASGNSGDLHHIETGEGVRIVRSPEQYYPPGREVVIKNGRPYASGMPDH